VGSRAAVPHRRRRRHRARDRLPDSDRDCGLAGPARIATGAEPVRAQRRRHALLAAARGGIAVPARRALVGGRGPAARRVGKAIPARERPVHRPRLSPSVDRRHRGLRLERSREAQRRGLARGEAIETVFRLTYLYGLLGGLIPESPALLAAATYGWLALLVASPLLVVATGRVRATLAGILVAAHLSMAFTLQIGVFSMVSATALLPFFPSFVWDRIESLATPTIERFRSTDERLLPFLRSSVSDRPTTARSPKSPPTGRLVTVSPPPSPRSSSSPCSRGPPWGSGSSPRPNPSRRCPTRPRVTGTCSHRSRRRPTRSCSRRRRPRTATGSTRCTATRSRPTAPRPTPGVPHRPLAEALLPAVGRRYRSRRHDARAPL